MLHAGKLEIEGELLNNYSFIQAKNISESIYKLNVKNLKVLHPRDRFLSRWAWPGLLGRPMTSAGAWNEIREMRGKGHNLSGQHELLFPTESYYSSRQTLLYPAPQSLTRQGCFI